MNPKIFNYRLQFITHFNEQYSYTDSARMALEGGCRWIQLRMKEADPALIEETAVTIQQMCQEHGATFIIDDHVWLAQKLKADGVHLGKTDMPVAEARKILGEPFIIGGTVNTLHDVTGHLQGAAPDYFGCGPFRYTSTKKNLSPILGHEGYSRIIRGMREAHISIPLVAIGGIRKEDIPSLLEIGVSGIALSSSILHAADPVMEVREIVNIIQNKYPY